MVKQLKLINDFYYCRPGKGALSSNTCFLSPPSLFLHCLSLSPLHLSLLPRLSFSPVSPSLSPLSLSLFLPCISFSHPRLSTYLSLSHSCLSFYLSLPSLSLFFSFSFSHPCFSLSHPCRLPLLHPLMSSFLSFSHPCLSLSIYSYISLSHHASLSISLSLFLPPLSLYLLFSLSLSPLYLFLPPRLSTYLSLSHSCLFLSFSLSLPLLSLSIFLSHPCLSFSFSHPCFSLSHPCRLPLLVPLISSFLSFSHLCLSLPISLSHHASLSLRLSLSLSLPLLSLILSFFLPSLSLFLPLLSFFLSFSLCDSCLFLPHLSFFLSLEPRSLFISFSLTLSLICTIRDVDCCAHKKSFNTVIPVRSLGPYMRVHYCTYIAHILVKTYLFLLTSFFDYLSFVWIVF